MLHKEGESAERYGQSCIHNGRGWLGVVGLIGLELDPTFAPVQSRGDAKAVTSVASVS